MKLLLFDIDGTLMLSGGAGRRAMNRAFFEIHGIDNAFDGIAPYGKTDPAIFAEIYANHGIGPTIEDNVRRALSERYAHYLPDEVRTSTDARLMPGVLPLLEQLSMRDDLSLGLLTGNFETTARIKLSRFDLNRFFSFGAFGSDHGEREHLVPIAVHRAAAHLDTRVEMGPDVAVIGDTPRDVECALAHGATAIGVGAAHYSAADLETAGAHHAFADLEDVDGFLRAIET